MKISSPRYNCYCREVALIVIAYLLIYYNSFFTSRRLPTHAMYRELSGGWGTRGYLGKAQSWPGQIMAAGVIKLSSWGRSELGGFFLEGKSW